MNTRHEAQWNDWRWQLRHAIRSVDDLIKGGWITPHATSVLSQTKTHELSEVTTRYKTLITPYYLSLIDLSDPQCPIRKQSIPHLDELLGAKGEQGDPIGDRAHAPTPILVHRYPDRALLFPTYECPMFCRYCFRKEALNEKPIKLHQALSESLEYLRQHSEIEELILSGGDPLMLSSDKLSSLIESISTTNVKRLRIHSRTPVTLPQRIDETLCQALKASPFSAPITLITHFNHPRELSEVAVKGLRSLRSVGLNLLNQSVLLKGVNDDLNILKELSHRLSEHGVIPYYLHHTDLTRGTQHFRCSLDDGLKLYRALRGQISGYLIPRYVIEIPGGGGKVELDSSAVIRGERDGEWWLESPLTMRKYQYFDLTVNSSDDRSLL